MELFQEHDVEHIVKTGTGRKPETVGQWADAGVDLVGPLVTRRQLDVAGANDGSG